MGVPSPSNHTKNFQVSIDTILTTWYPRSEMLRLVQCKRCNYQWATRGKPLRCADCRSPYWDSVRVAKLGDAPSVRATKKIGGREGRLAGGGAPKPDSAGSSPAPHNTLPEYPENGSRGSRHGGFMWYGQECEKTCTCRLCVDWRKKLGISVK